MIGILFILTSICSSGSWRVLFTLFLIVVNFVSFSDWIERIKLNGYFGSFGYQLGAHLRVGTRTFISPSARVLRCSIELKAQFIDVQVIIAFFWFFFHARFF